ncbi:hypothetical protein PM082_011231 [Marasmius tenuissimus]|nr:hypothetical protein PM082_011231 [Marasmius tenuissimus]
MLNRLGSALLSIAASYKPATTPIQNINHGTHQNNYHGQDQNINDHLHSANTNPAYERLVSAATGVGASHKTEHQSERGCCLPGTRVEAIRAIHDWRTSRQQKHPICWLSGAAGVGKSAIAMTIAQDCETEGVLASSFFCQSDPKHNNSLTLIPTIARDLASATPLLRNHIEQVISKNPTILEDTLEAQYRELVVEPILTWSAQRPLCGGSDAPNIIIVDGLDECVDERTQLRILSMIQSAYEETPGLPLRFLICSRPESWIREAFTAEPLFQLSKTIVLDNSLAAREDIRRYLVYHFQKIITSRQYRQVRFPNPWPSKEDLEILVDCACGQFAYASTVVEFIQLASQCPMEQLRTILENPVCRSRTSPYRQLDALYDLTLSRHPNHEELLPILAAILVFPEHQQVKTPACIELVLRLPKGQVAATLRTMHSVLDIGESEDDIKLYCTTFRDYLTDQTRSRNFYIDIPTWTDDIARGWLQKLTTRNVPGYRYEVNRPWMLPSRPNFAYTSSPNEHKTGPFFTKWIEFCVNSIPNPSRDLLDVLLNVDRIFLILAKKAEMELTDDSSWEHLFVPLVRWMRMYVCREHGTGALNKDYLHLVGRVTDRFECLPVCFHLKWPPGVPPPEQVTIRSIPSRSSIIFDNLKTSNGQLPRLTECNCDLSEGNKSSDPFHLAHQEFCMRVVKESVAHLEKLVRSGDKDEGTIHESTNIFQTLASSWLLRHCCVDTEILSLCQTFLGLAKDCSFLEVELSSGEKARENLLEWIETLPENFAKEMMVLKAQVLVLPWEQWAQAYNDNDHRV